MIIPPLVLNIICSPPVLNIIFCCSAQYYNTTASTQCNLLLKGWTLCSIKSAPSSEIKSRTQHGVSYWTCMCLVPRLTTSADVIWYSYYIYWRHLILILHVWVQHVYSYYMYWCQAAWCCSCCRRQTKASMRSLWLRCWSTNSPFCRKKKKMTKGKQWPYGSRAWVVDPSPGAHVFPPTCYGSMGG